MKSTMPVRLISFLQEELEISAPEITLVQRQGEAANLLSMILWQYGLLTLEQLDRVFNWLKQNLECNLNLLALAITLIESCIC